MMSVLVVTARSRDFAKTSSQTPHNAYNGTFFCKPSVPTHSSCQPIQSLLYNGCRCARTAQVASHISLHAFSPTIKITNWTRTVLQYVFIWLIRNCGSREKCSASRLSLARPTSIVRVQIATSVGHQIFLSLMN
jgi:hypothetical protein